MVVAVIAGVVQGIVEWLPISSQGNLSIVTTAVGGVVDLSRVRQIEDMETPVAVELEAGGERWLAASGPDAPRPVEDRPPAAVAVAERRVTVRTAPGENVRGTLTAVVWR